MNFLNIKYFMAIAEEHSISAAARKLYVSQQSLSEHIKKLETELNVPLFKRESPLVLTVAGECFMDGAKEIMHAYNRMLSNITDVTESRRSKITIGIATYGDPPFLADFLGFFMNKYPHYEVTVVKRFHTDIAHNMRGVDLYISYLPVDEDMEHAIIIKNDPYCVLFHKDLAWKTYGDHWPEREKELLNTQDLSLLKEMPFLILKDRHGQMALCLSEIFSEYQFTPKIGFASENADLNADMCPKGVGCLLAPTDYTDRCFTTLSTSTKADLLRYPIAISCFRPALVICYEKGKYLHAAELCFINELNIFFLDT